MKALLKCKINSVTEDVSSKGDKIVGLNISTDTGVTVELGGKTLPCNFVGTLQLKPVVAGRLKIGSVINVEINVDE